MTGPAGPDGPVQLVVRAAARGDLDQHVAEPGLGIGHLFEDEPADAGRFVEADGLHRWFPSGPPVGVAPVGGPAAAPPARGWRARQGSGVVIPDLVDALGELPA